MNLTSKAHVVSEFSFQDQPVTFQVVHLFGFALEDFYAAGSTARIPATAMQNIHARIFNGQDQLRPC